jgi:NADPH:quinone reductase-like Zn-dependent oxidoreductase
MPRAVRFDRYGEVEVLRVEDVPRPEVGRDRVLVEVRAAGINPGEAMVRRGLLHDRWPATFPSGQGSDLAGVVAEVGPDVTGFRVGDQVLGFTHDRASHADLVAVPAAHLTLRPEGLSWEAAGALFVAGTTAYASVRAVGVRNGDVVVVSAAAGGVGSIAVQLANYAGATVIGLASPANHDWLREHDVIPVAYGNGVEDRIRAAAPGPIDAFIDTFGAGYVDLAVALGVAPQRINTIIDFSAAEKYGTQTKGNNDAATADILDELAALAAKGIIDIPIAAVYPLDQVQAAFRHVEERHTRGKIVLKP